MELYPPLSKKIFYANNAILANNGYICIRSLAFAAPNMQRGFNSLLTLALSKGEGGKVPLEGFRGRIWVKKRVLKIQLYIPFF